MNFFKGRMSINCLEMVGIIIVKFRKNMKFWLNFRSLTMNPPEFQVVNVDIFEHTRITCVVIIWKVQVVTPSQIPCRTVAFLAVIICYKISLLN
jgi:hypothetical protein